MMKKIVASTLALVLLMSSATLSFAKDGERGRSQGEREPGDHGNLRLNDDNLKVLKNWNFNSGIAGTVTAVSGNTITIKVGENNMFYTVDTTNAKIQVGKNIATTAAVMVGNAIFVQGVINGNTIVATSVIVAKSSDGLKNTKKVQNGFVGTITAINGDSVTILAKNGTSYSVAIGGAKIWSGKNQTSSTSSLAVGKTVIVDGTITNTAVVARNVYLVTLPTPSVSAGISGTVTAISGTTITMLAANGSTYSVNTTNAEIKSAKNKDIDHNTIAVGDSITVRGTVTGTTIEATSVVDIKIGHGIFSNIGKFFKRIFGNR